LFAGGNRVTSSNNSDGTILSDISKDVNNSESSLGESFEFEDSHGSVHDDGLAVREGLLLLLGGLRTIVKSHPAIRDGINGDNLGLGIRGERIGNNDVRRKKNLLSKLLGLLQDFLGGVNEVILDKRGSNSKTLGLEEGENHTSSDDDLVALIEKSLKDGDLGRNLGSTNNGSHGLLSSGDSSVKVFKLLGEQESRNRRCKELGHTLSGGMSTVSGTESIIDEKIEGCGKLLNEFRLVLGFLLVETGVLEHDNITFGSISNNLGNIITNAVRGKGDFLVEEFRHTFGARSEGEFVLGTILRAAQMGADSDNGTLALQEFNCGDGRTDTGIISDGLSVKGNIDITTNKDLLSLEFVIGQILNGFLGFKLEN